MLLICIFVDYIVTNQKNNVMDKKRTHCESCVEWLEGFDTCSECGRINS